MSQLRAWAKRSSELLATSRVATAEHFRPDLEGLRAVAVILVLLYHARVPGFSGGYIGVDVFFVLSGFFITGLVIREMRATGSLSLSGFYARRARRLLPRPPSRCSSRSARQCSSCRFRIPDVATDIAGAATAQIFGGRSQ